ncbi:MAG: hypothetical protein IIZ93_09265 [Acidaminococcaceae bacterium]|nr:hypothetical protein [Acidaminococcaceae bacterium]
MRLIDAHKLYEQYEADMCELVKSTNCENISLEALSLLCGAKLIADAPTVDAAPVVHGRWIENEGFDGDCYYTCSVCQCDWTTIDGTPTENNMRYCPECGAKMDLEERNE